MSLYLKRENGFFIVDNGKYRDQKDFRKNAYDLTKLEKTFPATPEFWDNKWKLHFKQIKYLVREGRICLDSDSQDITDIIDNIIKVLDLNTYSYYTNQEEGKKHFWFALPPDLQKCSNEWKSHVKTGAVFSNLDTRGYGRGDKNSKLQGAVFLRNERKADSKNRPNPFELLENIDKDLSAVPIFLILPTKVLDWQRCAKPRSAADDTQKKFYSYFLRATYLFKKELPFDNVQERVFWLQNYMDALCVFNDLMSNPITQQEYQDTWDRCEKYYEDEAEKTAEIIKNKQHEYFLKRLVFWDKYFYIWNDSVHGWVKVDVSSNQDQITYVRRHLGIFHKDYNEFWKEVKYQVYQQSFYREVKPKYNPIFRNGYFDSKMEFILFEEDEVVPFITWLWMLDVNYPHHHNISWNSEVSNWLTRMFGNLNKAKDFFMCASPILSNRSNTLWIHQ